MQAGLFWLKRSSQSVAEEKFDMGFDEYNIGFGFWEVRMYYSLEE